VSEGCARLLVLVLSLACVSTDAATQADRSVLDGVYNQAQLNRGRSAYNRHCRSCHANDLQGGGVEPPLADSLFLDAWREDYLASLYQFTATRMPRGRNAKPGSLKDSEYLDIIAYIIARNGFPAGNNELTHADLSMVYLVGLQGPAALPPNAMMRTAGCLVQQGQEWRLEQAAAPSRVREGDVTDEVELALSAAAHSAAGSYRLNNLDVLLSASTLQGWQGQRVQAKGVLNGSADTARIFVLSLTGLEQSCD
jgi:S-disulfanyl-L-cysteine oxidoreductase SoxD